jgi:hypothetical protein
MEPKLPAMHVAKIERRHGERVYVSYLVRRSVREGKRVRHETVANVSRLPREAIQVLRRVLAGEPLVAAGEALAIERSLPHGHVAAVLGTLRALGLERLLARERSRERDLAVALICQRLLCPGSKLAATRQFRLTTLGEELGVGGAGEAEVLAALDWLGERQERVERALARRHLAPGGFVLYDLSTSYLEGTKCELAGLGYSRDGKRGTLQIAYGLVCAPDGRPVAVEVHPGGVHDHETLPTAVERVRQRFGIERVVFCFDRGMVTHAHIEMLRRRGVGWISALRAKQVQRLARAGELQLSLFDELSLVEIESADFPGERLVVCRNPLVAAERARKREALLQATEALLDEIRVRVERGTLQGRAAIGLTVGAVANRYRVKKHFELAIEDERFAFARKQAAIAEEAALDGIYVLRTSVAAGELAAPAIVRGYKQLARVERAFRTLKAPELELRPVYHRLAARVRAHVFLCMLAYYLAFELEQRLAELLFKDETPLPSLDPVAKAQRSPAANAKAQSKRTASGLPVHNFTDLLAALATLTRNRIRLHGADTSFDQLAEPTPFQRRALELLALNPRRL